MSGRFGTPSTRWQRLGSNPKPQLAAAPQAVTAGTNGDRLVLVLVGLPGTGKTYIARRLCQYLSFFHGATVKLFNVGQYRRKTFGAAARHDFFDQKNDEFMEKRREIHSKCMGDLTAWLQEDDVPRERPSSKHAEIKKTGVPPRHNSSLLCDIETKPTGRVAIYDASNETCAKRAWILEQLEGVTESRRHIVFIESVCSDPDLIASNIVNTRQMPDYLNVDYEDLVKDYLQRVEHYREVYEPIGTDDGDLTWIRLVDCGTSIAMHKIRGHLQGRIVQFLMNLHTLSRPIYLSRHGESEYNKLSKLGGDSSLSEEGSEYAHALASWVHTELLGLNPDGSWRLDEKGQEIQQAPHIRLFTSSLKRTRETAQYIQHPITEDGWVLMRPRIWRSMDEIYAGVFDGMTYEEVKEVALDEFKERQQNKLTYRYPRGESYLDVIERLEPVVHELSGQRDPILLVGHQGILRIIYSYFMGLDRSQAPFIDIPHNTIIKLTPGTYECEEERFYLRHGRVDRRLMTRVGMEGIDKEEVIRSPSDLSISRSISDVSLSSDADTNTLPAPNVERDVTDANSLAAPNRLETLADTATSDNDNVPGASIVVDDDPAKSSNDSNSV